ncbi:unnamed protein product [Spirodela intermedia]|uniref:Uncharacterized protein n=1 Tax=Spirodela intermedia TaxID=51605 RepID=A0A7I8J5U3_SPIIN|nr:unnamed protein product [Spirodela intermedia]CAA6665380.1 unnamed protein product [Spirodela intermedia]
MRISLGISAKDVALLIANFFVVCYLLPRDSTTAPTRGRTEWKKGGGGGEGGGGGGEGGGGGGGGRSSPDPPLGRNREGGGGGREGGGGGKGGGGVRLQNTLGLKQR